MSSRNLTRHTNPALGAVLFVTVALVTAGCGDKADGQASPAAGRSGRDGMMAAGMGRPGPAESAAVPVQVQAVERSAVSRFLETNGVLEAENEVDIVARVSGPVTELLTEEGQAVRAGQLLARIDDREARNQVALSTVNRDEARLAYERAQSSFEQSLIAREAYDAALAKLESAEAQLASSQLQLDYTRITAPFDALVVTRYVKLAQHVSNGSPLFRLSDFTPLLCPIQVPEKELPNVHIGQRARLEVDAYPGRAFSASVLRISPTVDASTGTLRVTLEVDGRGVLRPGLFADVKLETDRHENALVIAKTALVMDSIGDTVYVRNGDVAGRREIKLGFREGDRVEVLDGLAEGEEVVVLGQEGLSDGTPITVLASEPTSPVAVVASSPPEQRRRERAADGAAPPAVPAEPGATRPVPAEQGAPGSGGPHGPGAFPPGGGMPPQFVERLRTASPEELEKIKERMRQRGMSDEQIESLLRSVRGGATRPTPAAQ